MFVKENCFEKDKNGKLTGRIKLKLFVDRYLICEDGSWVEFAQNYVQ
jgi:hypothetical protein